MTHTDSRAVLTVRMSFSDRAAAQSAADRLDAYALNRGIDGVLSYEVVITGGGDD